MMIFRDKKPSNVKRKGLISGS